MQFLQSDLLYLGRAMLRRVHAALLLWGAQATVGGCWCTLISFALNTTRTISCTKCKMFCAKRTQRMRVLLSKRYLTSLPSWLHDSCTVDVGRRRRVCPRRICTSCIIYFPCLGKDSTMSCMTTYSVLYVYGHIPPEPHLKTCCDDNDVGCFLDIALLCDS